MRPSVDRLYGQEISNSNLVGVNLPVKSTFLYKSTARYKKNSLCELEENTFKTFTVTVLFDVCGRGEDDEIAKYPHLSTC